MTTTTDTHAPDEDYFERIERHFGLRRGGRLMLSPRDWQLVAKWQERGLPVAVVLRGINRAFDLFEVGGPRADRINSLRYCRQHVEEAWEEHRELQATDGTGARSGGLEAAGDHFEAVAARVRLLARQLDGDAADDLLEIASELEGLGARSRSPEADVRALDAEAEALEGHAREAIGHRESESLDLPRFSPWAA